MVPLVLLPLPQCLHRHFILAGRAILMMVMSWYVLQVVDCVCPSGGERLPLVAADTQQPVVPPVPVVTGTVALLRVRVHLRHPVVSLHGGRGGHKHVCVREGTSHRLLAEIGSSQREQLVRRQQRVAGLQAIGREHILRKRVRGREVVTA